MPEAVSVVGRTMTHDLKIAFRMLAAAAGAAACRTHMQINRQDRLLKQGLDTSCGKQVPDIADSNYRV